MKDKAPTMKEKAQRLIDRFNKEKNRMDRFISSQSILFNIVCILDRIEHIRESHHSQKEFLKYQHDLSKALSVSKKVDKIILSNPKGRQVQVTSKLLINIMLSNLDFNHSKKSKGGKPENEEIGFCSIQIMNLKKEGVPVEFIASLFKMNTETFERTLRRKRTKPPALKV